MNKTIGIIALIIILAAGGYYYFARGHRASANTPPVSTNTNTNSKVTIYSLTPETGAVGTTVTIDGFGFTADNMIHFGSGVIAHATSTPGGRAIMCARGATNCHPGVHQQITFVIPDSVGPYCKPGDMCPMYLQKITPGTYGVSVENTNGTSTPLTFTVTK